MSDKQTTIPGQRRDIYINGPLTARVFNMAIKVDGLQRDITAAAMTGGKRGQLSREADRRLNAALDHLEQELKDLRRQFGDGRRSAAPSTGENNRSEPAMAGQKQANAAKKGQTTQAPTKPVVVELKASAEAATEKKVKTVSLKKQDQL